MSDPHQPFRRPQRTGGSDVGETATHPTPSDPGTAQSDQALILDPELHQSVLNPWHDPVEAPKDDRDDGSPLRHHRRRFGNRPAIVVVTIAAALVLITAVMIPRLQSAPEWHSQPLVMDMPTQPTIAWSTEGGLPCLKQSDDDAAILTDERRVWSLDLNSGETLWSVEFDGQVRVSCLPEPNLVAVSMDAAENQTVPNTKFLDASTGAEFAELPARSSVHVLPLGPVIGLVDDSDLLSAVRPDDLETALWGRQLPPIPDVGAWLVVDEVDDNVVQIVSYGDPEGEGLPAGFVLPLTTADGTMPQWAQSPAAEGAYHHRVGNVILRSEHRYVDSTTSVLDLEGHELWDVGNSQLGVAGTHLFVSWPSSSDPATGYSNLHEVDPRTGTAVNGYDYTGWFDKAVGVQDHIAVLRGGTLHILDDKMREQPAIAVEGISDVHEGDKRAYVSSATNESDSFGSRLSAINPGEDEILWTLELQEDQQVWQLGRHLVVTDGYGFGPGDTIHGLRSN